MDAFIAQCEYMDKLKKKGTVKMFVPFTGIDGGFFVVETDSNAGVSQILSECPMFPYVSREIYALTEDSKAKQIVSKMKERMSKGS